MDAHYHPELRSAARRLPKAPVRTTTVPILRVLSRMYDKFPAPDIEVLTTASGIRVRLHRPKNQQAPGPALLWIHGGGYVLGTPAQDDYICKRFAAKLGVTVAAVDYRLAPEHPYPVPLEDCYQALTWLASLPAVDSGRMAIAGASAGGGLTAALAFLTRDRGAIDLMAQILVYPMLDDRVSHIEHRHDPLFRVWDRISNNFGWNAYLSDADPSDAVPARRTDLAGLPPTWIGVGSLDLFCDEDLEYAERLRAAGVRCRTHVIPGAFHGFDMMMPRSRVAREFFGSQCDMLREVLESRQ